MKFIVFDSKYVQKYYHVDLLPCNLFSEHEYIFLLEYHFIDDVVFQLRAAGHCCMLELEAKAERTE